MQTTAEVVKLDKSLPLIQVADGFKTRAEFCATLSKKHASVAIGDEVRVSFENETRGIRDQGLGISGDLGIRDEGLGISSGLDCPCRIEEIYPRKTTLVRNDPVNRRKEQVLAANFDQIAICVVAGEENFNHLARMLAIACNAEVPITLIFTKCDLGKPNLEAVEELAGSVSTIIGTTSLRHPERSEFECAKTSEVEGSPEDADNQTCPSSSTGKPLANDALTAGGTSWRSFDSVFLRKPKKNSTQDDILPFTDWQGKTTVLLGKSGAGKSTLINALAGKEVCKQGEVREFDSKGRHTTVSREIIEMENFGRIVDMPGIRSLGLINCEAGLEKVFSEIYNFSQKCKFRDCQHTSEPGCVVKGNVSDQLLCAFHELTDENKANLGIRG